MTPLRRTAGLAGLLLAVLVPALLVTGLADGAKKSPTGRVVRLDKSGKVPSKYVPTVRRARIANRLGELSPGDLVDDCGEHVDLKTWCLMSATFPVDNQDVGKNDYFYASKKCGELGGWLPTASQLLSAADNVKLSSVLTDSRLTAAIDVDPSDGLKDQREMTSTLITTTAGASAAGSAGVSDGAKGDPRTGEPDPTPQPADPAPDTLQYVTVYDNGNRGGFAGAKPVGDPERFRCAFGRTQGLEGGEG